MNVSEILARNEKIQAELFNIKRGERRSPAGFEHVFRATTSSGSASESQSSVVHKVRRGENLSVICQACLERQGLDASPGAVHRAVASVARANGIKNPDLIFPGQKIDLSVISRAEGSTPQASASLLPKPKGGPIFPLETPVIPPAIDFTARRAPRSPAEAANDLRKVAAGQESHATDGGRHARPWEGILEGRGVLTSPYGMRKDPFSGEQGLHKGIDIAAPKGSEIRALKDGVVTFAGWQSGYGNVVIVQHDQGLETRYAHASETLVEQGQRVGEGAPIASVGSTGRSTGNHLHFEVRRDGETVNPIAFLKDQRLQIAEVL